jgi:ubiquitin carboxyl-terminal hydrolase 7
MSHAEATHSFHKSEADWGFADFLPLTELKNNVRGFVREDDSLHFKVSVEVDTLQSSCYDSRKETGYVGLRNQGDAWAFSAACRETGSHQVVSTEVMPTPATAGATCYLNSWLQTLFNINCFREVGPLTLLYTERTLKDTTIPL